MDFRSRQMEYQDVFSTQNFLYCFILNQYIFFFFPATSLRSIPGEDAPLRRARELSEREWGKDRISTRSMYLSHIPTSHVEGRSRSFNPPRIFLNQSIVGPLSSKFAWPLNPDFEARLAPCPGPADISHGPAMARDLRTSELRVADIDSSEGGNKYTQIR